MPEYGNAVYVDIVEGGPDNTRSIAEHVLKTNFERTCTERPEWHLKDFDYQIKDGGIWPVYGEYTEDEDGNTVGVGPVTGWQHYWGWYVNTGEHATQEDT